MATPVITTYNENPLHSALKTWYGGPDGAYEVPVDGFVVDLVRDGLLVEIQTELTPRSAAAVTSM